MMCVLLTVASGCGSGAPHTAKAVCSESLPHWRTASVTTVASIRHFKTSGLQKVSPFAHAFGSVADRALAAWCWTSPKSRTYRAYAATHGQKPILIAEIEGQAGGPPKGPPVIL